MSEPLTIVVAWNAGRSAPNCLRRMCWQARKRVADEAKAAATIAWRQAGSPMGTEPVAVAVTIRRGRELDPDNAIAALRDIINALFVGRITPDDTSAWMELVVVRQETGKEWKAAPEVVFRVFPRETATARESGCAALLEEIEETP